MRGDRSLTEPEIRQTLIQGLQGSRFAGRHVLVVIPDSTRTAPIPLMYRLLHEVLGPHVKALDFLVAFGTHPAMSDEALGRLVGVEVADGATADSKVFNHRWDLDESFVTVGVIPASEIREASNGLMDLDVPVRLNRLVGDPNGERPYDEIVVCGPVFPHEVAGFSGGNKYFVPGVSGQEVIDVTHWLGALLTSKEIIGVADTPMRRLINRAASFIPTPASLVAMVMHGEDLRGLFVGEMDATWKAATELSEELDIVWVDRPYRRVLSVVPEMYDDLWTGAKGMYKLEPAIADGGEVVIFAPHITDVSYVHGATIDEIGYHVRDYFTSQWERFTHVPWGILAHSTHLRGAGSFENGVEKARIDVTLATGIPRERCERIGLGYLDPASIEFEEWEDRQDEGTLLVPRAGEQLFRVRPENTSGNHRR